MVNIRKVMHNLRNEGLSLHSVGKLFYEKHTHLLLLKKQGSSPKIVHAAIDVEFLFLKDNNYRKNVKYVKEIDTMMFEDTVTIDIVNIEKKVHNNSECLIAIFNNSVVGYIWIHFKNHKPQGIKNMLKLGSQGVYIGPAFVSSRFRGKKVYEALLSRSFKYSYELGCTRIYGSVTPENKPSIKGGLKIGYKPIEVHHRIRIGPFVFFPKTKNGELEYYSHKYYNQ